MAKNRFFLFFRYLNFTTLKRTFTRAFQRRLAGLSGEMAYNAMLALFPAILAILTAISTFQDSVESSLINIAAQLREIVPQQVWELLIDFVEGIKIEQGSGWFSVSFIAAIWVSSAILSTAMNALDHIHQVPPRERRPFWKAKIIAIILTIGTIALLIVASFLVLIGDFTVQLAVEQNWGELLLSVWRILGIAIVATIIVAAIFSIVGTLQVPKTEQKTLAKVRSVVQVTFITTILLFFVNFALNYIKDLIARAAINQTVEFVLISAWRLLSWPVALSIVATAFAFVYRFGPSRWTRGTPIMPGALLAAISWAAVSALFRLYVTNFGQYNRVYGAVGAVIVLMLWLYMSSFVMLLGDQLNATVGEAMRERQKQKHQPALEAIAAEINHSQNEETSSIAGDNTNK